ncbi:MAG: FtsX-like permease family protein, partial [Verrucomicrobiales bacterium]|nr:FtsX-like permease family protein [Verrucomicrobiales bacterium]
DQEIIGRVIALNGEPYTIVGVMPRYFRFPSAETELWVPMAFAADELANRGGHTLNVIGRLKPKVSVARAESDMKIIAKRLEQEYPESNKGWTVTLAPMLAEITEGTMRPLFVLLGAVGLVLLIGCANVANLLLARAASRQKEFAIRCALGAGNGRVVGQLVTESLLLGIIGGLFGLLLAVGGIKLLLRLRPANLPRLEEITLDGRVLIFTILVSLFTGLAFGLLPALRASKFVQRKGSVLDNGYFAPDLHARAIPGYRVRAR